jgi:DNA-binding NtrC family response regulator
MPARIVVAHDDPEFVGDTVTALWDAGYEVVSFADSMSALDALEAAQHVEMLITRVLFPEGTPNGVTLGRSALGSRCCSSRRRRRRRILKASASSCRRV